MIERATGNSHQTTEPVTDVANQLSQYSPGHLPQPVFIEVARLTVTPVVEIVPVHDRGGQTSILMTRRPSDDPVWPDLWHTPGTVIRAYDRSIDHAVTRLLSVELEDKNTSEPQYVGHLLHQVLRGTELALVYWVEVKEEIDIGTFFDASRLPGEMVDSQRSFIAWALESYRSRKDS